MASTLKVDTIVHPSGTPDNLTLDNAGNVTVGNNLTVTGTTTQTGTTTFTGQALFHDGTVSAPAISNTGDTNCGIYFPAADTLGFVTSGSEDGRFDSVGNLLLNSATLSPTQTAAGSIAMTGTLAMGSSFKRNRIINGDMRVDQRNAGASVTPTASAYTLDRWDTRLTQASKYSVIQSTTVPDNTFTNSILVTSTSAYSVLSSDNFGIQQGIEGFNSADLAWGTSGAKSITISFWARSSITGTNTYTGSIRNSAADRSYVFTYTLAQDTWTYVTVVVPGPTDGTWLTNNGVGIYLQFSLGTGSNFNTTAFTWQNANRLSVSGATPIVGTNGATFYITGVQLEVGSVATPYERQIYSEQLAQCQRYYQVYGGSDGYLIGGNVNAASDQYGMVIFPVKMRASPTATSSGTWTTSNVTTTKPSINTVSASSACVYGSTSSSGNWYFQANSSDDTLTFSAEL